jgi:glycosyltransferase involved in cell wall biosynthesis
MQDLRILSHIFRVIPVQWTGVVSIANLFLATLHSDVIFVWWIAGQAATAALIFGKVFRKITIFVPGGNDVAVDRDIHGRDLRSVIRFTVTKIIIRLADCVIPVSEFTLGEVLSISAPKRYRVVYNAVDAGRFICSHTIPKQRDIITLISGGQYPTHELRRKGLDRYAKLVQLLPNFKFHVLGSAGSDTRVKNLFPPGVCVGRVSEDELVLFYEKATFYCQLSRHEGFGVAVAEAMACECVPVVSDCGALPEVVADCGVFVPNGDPLIAARLIQESLPRARFLGRSARKRILSKFSVEGRSRELRNVILSLIVAKKKSNRPGNPASNLLGT